MKRTWALVLAFLCSLAIHVTAIADMDVSFTLDTGKAVVRNVTADDESITSEAVLTKGSSYRFSYTVESSTNVKASKVTWSSQNENVATVVNGNVTGKNAGSTVISCMVELEDGSEIGGSIQVTVEVAVNSIRAKTQSITVNTNETSEAVELTFAPADATCQEVTWSVADETIATVDAEGKVTGVKAGRTTLTVTSAENVAMPKKVAIPVVVSQPVQSVNLSAAKAEVAKGKNLKLTADILPADSSNQKTTWSTSDPTIATVANGVVNGKACGTVVITCAAADGNGAEATCEVEVFAPVTSVNFESKNATAFVDGESISLAADVKPEEAKYKSLTWVSSDESIATVDQNGVVTPIKNGKVTITATANDRISDNAQQKKASCVVSVDQAVKEIKIEGGNQTLAKGKTVKLVANVGPEDATNKKLVWSSSDSEVVTVANGNITGKKTGKATVTATAADGSGVSDSIQITVIQGVTSVKTDVKTLTLFAGQSGTVSASVQPSDATVQKIVWSSDNEDIATVDDQGNVSAKSKGTVNIIATATDGSNKSATIKVYVEPAVPLTIESLGQGVFVSNLLGITVRNQCAKTTIVNFDFDMTLISYYGFSNSGSYSIGKNATIGPGAKKTIKRTSSGVGSASQIVITITGVQLKDGTFYSIPSELQETWTFSF